MFDHKATTLSQQIAVHSQSPGCFISVCYPTKLGSLTSTSFGGSSLAILVNAAFQEIRDDFHLYSVSGYFVRPVKTDRMVICQVETVRKSKNLETKEIRLTQEYEDGVSKICLIALADFHAVELKSMLALSTAPELVSLPVFTKERPQKKPVQGSMEKLSRSDLYQDIEKFVEMRPLSSKERFTDKLTAPSPRIHAEKFRTRHTLHGEAEQISALAFYMDKGLAYIPALHHGYHPSQANACASLDFSLRFIEHEVKIEDWHYTQQKTLVANHARAYSEGRVWDSRGRLLASMTQQTILRPDSEMKSRF